MKKLIITIVVIAALVGLYVWAKSLQVRLSPLEGEIVIAKRGDLVVPITASGKIEPANIVNIKSEASGTVVETPFEEGQMVKVDDLIVRLDEEDESRNVERAEADWERAKIALAKAKINKEQSEKVGVPLAEAKQEIAEARLKLAEIDYKKTEDLYTKGTAAEIEWQNVQARMTEANANKKAAVVELDQAKISVQLAGEEVKTAEQMEKTAKKTLEDAQQRLRETKVRSPINGMVLRRQVQKGEVILSGKTSLVGGTDLMQIADISNIYAVVNVDEADIGMVHTLAPESARPGQPATTRPETTGKESASTTQPEQKKVDFPEEILNKDELVELTVESFPEEKFYGVIERISPLSEIVQAIATFRVRIRITSPNRDKLIALLNTQVEAQFTVHSLRNVVLVSYDAIQKNPDGEGFGVFVAVKKPGQPKAEPVFKRCVFGPDNAIDVAVLEGLEPGEIVYTKLPIKTEKERKQESQKKK